MSAPSLPALLTSGWSLPAPHAGAAMIAIAIYVWASRRAGSWPWRRTVAFAAGTASIVVALDSGLGAYDDTVLSVHMEQHLVLLELAPLLLLSGRPVLLAIRALPPSAARELARGVSRLRARSGAGAGHTAPLVGLVVFWVVVLGTHLPGFYDATLRDPLLHDAEHLVYIAAGLLLWWPVLGELQASGRRLGGLYQLAYVVLAMVPMELVGAYLSRASTVVYGPYALGGRATAAAVIDQNHAGAIMWVVGGMIATAVGLWTATAALLDEERRQRARDLHAARVAGEGR